MAMEIASRSSPARVVLWPADASGDARGWQQDRKIWGYRVDAQTFCVIALVADGVNEDAVGLCVLGRALAVASHARSETACNGEDESMLCARMLATTDKTPATLHISLVSKYAGKKGEAVVSASASCRVVFYDRKLAASGVLRRGVDAMPHDSTLYKPLHQICEHFEQAGCKSRQGALQRWLAQAIRLLMWPLCLLNVVAKIGASLLAMRILPKWLLADDVQLQDCSRFCAVLVHQIRAVAEMRLHRPTVHLMDTVVFLVLDHVAGRLIGAFLLQKVLFRFPLASPDIFISSVREHVAWLMDAPAGFKLNLPLATMLGNGILLWLDLWEFAFDMLWSNMLYEWLGSAPLLRRLATSVWSRMGLALQLSMLIDLVQLVTWSMRWVLLYFSKLHAAQRHLLSSLWLLFLGKKKNVLRNRVDSLAYDVNQLLNGTLLFTILVFLVTTHSVFYVYVALVRLGVWLSISLLWITALLLRVLPLASIALRLMQPLQFTAQLRVEVVHVAPAIRTLTLHDVAPSAPRTRGAADTDALYRHFAAGVATSDERNVHFRVVPTPAGINTLFARLQRYREVARGQYVSSALFRTCLLGPSVTSAAVDAVFGDMAGLPPSALRRADRKLKTA